MTAAAAAKRAADLAAAKEAAAEKAEAAGDAGAAEAREEANALRAEANARLKESDVARQSAVATEAKKKEGFFSAQSCEPRCQPVPMALGTPARPTDRLTRIKDSVASAIGEAAGEEVDPKMVDEPTPRRLWYTPERGWPKGDVESGAGLDDAANLQRLMSEVDPKAAYDEEHPDRPYHKLFEQLIDNRIGTLKVEVLEAQGLPEMDVSITGNASTD
eukprot:2083623-Prymnesium_polylepis.1